MSAHPSHQITADQSLLKRINRMALIRLVKAQPGLSRAGLAKHTGLTKSTVSVLVQGLIHEGWLREQETTASQGLGRRPTPLVLDPTHLGFLGAELGVDYLNVVACNLLGEILFSQMLPYQHQEVDRSVRELSDLVESAHGSLLTQHCRPLGVGVGVPGMIDLRDSRLKFAPNIGWYDVAIEKMLRAELDKGGCRDLPLSVLNDANAGALSEYVFGAEQNSAPLVYLNIGIGLGAGIVLGDRLYLGNDGLAGEVGHTILQQEGERCACGRRGCAETLISQRAVSRFITGQESPILSIGELVARISRNDDATRQASTRAGQYLGLLLHNLGNTINPGLFVLGGPLVQLGPTLVQTALETMKSYGGRYDFHRVTVRQCRFGINACAVGAAGNVLHRLLHPIEHPANEQRTETHTR
jgi:predicted NBD/HSP70 family sugar kinase